MDNKRSDNKAVVIIPTYNESGNIESLVNEISETVQRFTNKWDVSVLVVDGDSTDGTGEIVEKMIIKKLAESGDVDLHLLREPGHDGIGAAYCRGFKYAIQQLGAEVVIEFDGDFQHSPSHIPLLLSEIDAGYDYVVASRSIKGGGDIYKRSIFRKILTAFGGLVARLILFFPGNIFVRVTDPTTGLKATRVKGHADRLNLDSSQLISQRFGYKIQWLFETITNGAKYKEIPLRFENRRAGVSKFSWAVILDIIRVCFQVRLADKSTKQFIKYGIVGFGGYVINALLLSLLYKLIGIESVAWVLSAEGAILSNYFFNNIWTFGSKVRVGYKSWMAGLIKFNLTSLGAIVIEGIFGPVLTLAAGGHRQVVLVFVIMVLIVPYNWFMYNRFIWR
jgi:dolichol-phosphate mannosyltransferase